MPKLVHKILFSMPAGTPPGTLLAAVRNFAPMLREWRRQFARHLCALGVPAKATMEHSASEGYSAPGNISANDKEVPAKGDPEHI
jgi:hypothetical protein